MAGYLRSPVYRYGGGAQTGKRCFATQRSTLRCFRRRDNSVRQPRQLRSGRLARPGNPGERCSGAASAIKAPGTAPAPIKATAKRINLASILMLLLDSDTPTPHSPPVMGRVPNRIAAIGVAISPINLASYVTTTNADPVLAYVITGGSLPPRGKPRSPPSRMPCIPSTRRSRILPGIRSAASLTALLATCATRVRKRNVCAAR